VKTPEVSSFAETVPCVSARRLGLEVALRHHPWLFTALALSMCVLASCSDEPTQPNTGTDQPSAALANALASDTWLTRRTMPLERGGVVTAVVPNAVGQSILYAIGGYHPYRPYPSLARVQAYNVATNTWSLKKDLPLALQAINGAGVINGKIYVAGGTKNHYLGAVWALFVYDPATNTWTRKRAMPERGAGGVTGVINDQLYVVLPPAGTPTSPPEDYSNFLRYNPATNQWTKLPSPKHAYFMGGVLYGKLYVVGNEVEAYDPATNQWTAKASPPASDINIGGTAAAAGAKLYVFGGGKTLVYDPGGDTWTSRTPGPYADYSASRVFLNGKPRIELVGGSAAEGTSNRQYLP
jgi:N-acetylneuraminic acid mutarotase